VQIRHNSDIIRRVKEACMATRIVLATVAILSVVATPSIAQTPSAGTRPDSPDHMILVGCVARAADGLFLKTVAPDLDTRRHSAGTNSAKGSTPVGSGGEMVVRKTSSGSNSAKGSTPIPVAVGGTGERTSAVMTAKGSVPIASSAALLTYELDAASELFSPETDHVLEITGSMLAVPSTVPPSSGPASPSLAARRVKVESVKVLPSTCAR
jgi:hypothetical protein